MTELYKFTDGATVYRYTSADRDVTHDSATWTAIEISRSSFVSELEPERQRIDITVQRQNPVALLHLSIPPDKPIDVQIYQKSGEEYPLAWTGVVSGVQWSGPEATMQCESPIVLEGRLGLRQRFQVMCRHALYSEGCGVNPASFKATGTVSALSLDGLTIFADIFSAEPGGYYTGGHVIVRGQARLVSSHIGAGSIKVTRHIDGLTVGDAIDAFAGCNHSWVACKAKFSNLPNYGGFSTIPRTNPVGRNINERAD